MKQSGFTAVEIATLGLMMAVLVALVVVLMPAPVVKVEIKEVKVDLPDPGTVTFAPESFTFSPKELHVSPEKVILKEPQVEFEGQQDPPPPRGAGFEAQKMECINNVRMLSALLVVGNKYPEYSGPNFLLYLVLKGEIARDRDQLSIFFCPGDRMDTFENTGGVEAYKHIDLHKRDYGYLTSYAGRDQRNPACKVLMGDTQTHVLLCDDSEDHHGGRGIVVGLNDGSAKWRDKVDFYGMPLDAPIVIGERSQIAELTCLREE